MIKDPRAFNFIAAPFAPFHPDGSLNLERIGQLSQRQVEDGVAGVFINGTTGEGLSLTREERCLIAEHWKETTADKMQLIVHVGHNCLNDARELAAHAESIGADAIAAIGPSYYPAQSALALARQCTQIAEAAPHTPFYYYHMPSIARVSAKASEALPLLVKEVPTFAGIKFTHEDLDDYRLCLEEKTENLEIFFGRDELLLDALTRGATGAVGSTYNFATPLYRRIVAAYTAGEIEEARRLQVLATNAIRCMVEAGGMTAIKAVMAFVGLDCGAPRLPMEEPTASQKATLKAQLDALGYFEMIQKDSARAECVSCG
jgi:N-acetylneuraminate lyase